MSPLVCPGDYGRNVCGNAVCPQKFLEGNRAVACLATRALAHPLPPRTGPILPGFSDIPILPAQRLHLDCPDARWADKDDIEVGPSSAREEDIAKQSPVPVQRMHRFLDDPVLPLLALSVVLDPLVKMLEQAVL